MTIISQYLDANGDASGNKNFNGDYSLTEEVAFIMPPPGKTYYLARMIVSLEDTNGFTAEKYGDIAALANGVQMRAYSKGHADIICDFTDNIPVKTNAQWGSACFDVDVKTWGAGNELLLARFTFSKSGDFLVLQGDDQQSLDVTLNDDLSGLISHRFLVQGTYA